jgi:nitrate reductase / nitrite oxidoreductase, beta subunit
MARVYNWQLGREMSYWYPESRPDRQWAAVFDINKCIACQTCTLACKTTWTSGKGQEYMLWNNVETKPYGFYPLGWDVKLLAELGRRRGTATGTRGARSSRPPARASARSAGARRRRLRPPERRRGRLRRPDRERRGPPGAAHGVVLLPGAHLQPLHLPGLPRVVPARLDLQAPEDGIVLLDQGRCRGYQECVKACPYKKVFFNPMTGTSEKCIGCYPKFEEGLRRSAS